MQITLTRDSVHISDDIEAPHTKIINLEKLTLKNLYQEIKKIDYLPNFNGYQTWAIVGYSPISIVAHGSGKLLPLMNSEMLLDIELRRTNNKIHLCCFGGLEPTNVFKVLENYKNVRY